ncbi:MAG: hypothetical protein VCC04_12945, partial [Myxococcota bacterium]
GAAIVALFLVELLTAPNADAAGQQLCFYVDKGLPGHVFVQFLPTTGPQAGRTDLVRGKYPDGNPFKAGSEIKDDSKRAWSQRICFPVTVAQYNGAAAKVNGKQANPPPFNLLFNPPGNCVNWSTDTATAAGLPLPNKTGFLGIETPGALGRSLKAIGDGNGWGIGEVEYNDDPTKGASGEPVASNPPKDVDAEEAAYASHFDPGALGEFLEFPVFTESLGSVTTSVSGGFSIQVTNTAPEDALITVDWGDGSQVEGQVTLFNHLYEPGVYAPTLAVVDVGTVRRWSWIVTVNPTGSGSATQIVNVPTPVAVILTNPGFETSELISYLAPDVPGLSLHGVLMLVISIGVAAALVERQRKRTA